MRFVAIRKWLYLAASGACLLQSTGCPNAEQIRDTAVSGISSFANSVINMYVNAALEATLGAA